MALSESQLAILECIDSGIYQESLEAIDALPERERDNGRMIIAKGDCLYELADDLSAMREYIRYIEVCPGGIGWNTALMGIAMSLKNLDLQNEARTVLEKIEPDHYGRKEELAHSNEMLARQRDAVAIVASLLRKE